MLIEIYYTNTLAIYIYKYILFNRIQFDITIQLSLRLLPYTRQIMQIYNMTKFVLPDFVHGIIIVIGLYLFSNSNEILFSSLCLQPNAF